MKTATPPGAPRAAAVVAVAAPRRGGLAAAPLLLAMSLAAFLLLPRVQATAHLFWSFAGVAAGLVGWYALLAVRAARRGTALAVEPVAPIRQHYIQACVQLLLYSYWGWFWVADGVRPIYAQAPLILAQLCYLYAFDALFAWSRGRPWRLASGPVPIVLSTNLFIWFRDDWFVFQFAMVTAGLLGKEFIRWTRDGRRTHIFNPSGFGLACAASVLIATRTTDLTWAKPLATTIEVQHIFVVIFVLGLVVQHFFAVTLMTLSAALVMIAINLGYIGATGTYLFASSNLPAAAFLGLHLLMTDPSTSPRTNLGRVLFGAGYGFGYVVAFELLGAIGAPELFAKLYPVPVLNCTVRLLDRIARRGRLGDLNTQWETRWPARATNALHMAVWAAVFAVMLGTGYVEAPHPGNSIAFWKTAVAEHKPGAERRLVMVAGSLAVGQNIADAYNELGILSLETSLDASDRSIRVRSAARWFAEAAQRGSRSGTENLVQHFLYHGVHRSDRELAQALAQLERLAGTPDGGRAAFLIGLAYETGGGLPIDRERALAFYRRCPPDDLLALHGIVRIGLGRGASIDLSAAAVRLAAAAAQGDGESCFYLAYLRQLGRGGPADPGEARRLLDRAAELGFGPAIALRDALGADGGLPAFEPPRRRHLRRPAWSTAYPVTGAA